MRDLATINFVNAYAAQVEALKLEEGPTGDAARRLWPSDAPAITSSSNEREETHRLRSWNRRLTLLRSAVKRGEL